MFEQSLVRVSPDDPNRCQAKGQKGQCPFRSVEGTKYCARHSGKSKQTRQNQEYISNYRLQQYQHRLEELGSSEQSKSLRDEIGILRMTLENILNNCETPHAFLLNAGKISDIATKIEKVVATCSRLEQSYGLVLDKTAVSTLANKIVDIIHKYVEDPIIIANISDEIVGEIIELKPLIRNKNE